MQGELDTLAEASSSRPRFRRVEPGDELGRYQVIEELGAGGMATVYRARDRELRRDVAIKVLFPHLCKNREVVARFHREARAAAALDHPHILRVFDVGGGGEGDQPVDPPFIVLELVRGPSLDQLVAKGPLMAEVAAAVGAALASALIHAHKAGVIHRDIKPGNLMVAEGGRLVLADFGVARVAEEDSSLITRTGALLGTPAFMSPEQATGAALDARSDLYSVGATLYQLATGSIPVSGNPARAVAAIVSGEVVPPLRRNPAMGSELARLIERLMAIDPADRVAGATELHAELRGLVEASGAGEPDALLEEFFADREACESRLVPIAVAASVSRARRALEEGNAARALALCDRALALDAGCGEAMEIVEGIGRRRWAKRGAIAVLATAAVAGGGVVAWKTWPVEEARPVAVVPAAAFDAAAQVEETAPAEETVPVEVADAAPERLKPDAGNRRRATGNRTLQETEPAAIEKTPPVEIDAGPRPAAEKDARLTVEMDAWCDLVIDGEPRGQISKKRLTVTVRPGTRKVACRNKDLGTWTETVELAPGGAKTVKGTLVPMIAVSVQVTGGDAVRIDKNRVANRGSATLKRGSHRVEVLRGDRVVSSRWVTLTKTCTLVDRPEIGCIAPR